MDILYEDITLWEQESEFLEGWWSPAPLPNEDGVSQLKEGESIEAEEDLTDSWGTVFDLNQEVIGDGKS